MPEEPYFKEALSNFTFDVASGGAIRHLTDLGYTVKQISRELAFPTPIDRIQKVVWEHLLNRGILLLEEPGNGEGLEKFSYVRDYGPYGKASFRRVPLKGGAHQGGGPICWQEKFFCGDGPGDLASYLSEKCKAGENAYMSCDFGLRRKREPARWERALQVLEEGQRDYLAGVFGERRLVYHRLDQRMQKILVCLYGHGEYRGACYFEKTREKLTLTEKGSGNPSG